MSHGRTVETPRSRSSGNSETRRSTREIENNPLESSGKPPSPHAAGERGVFPNRPLLVRRRNSRSGLSQRRSRFLSHDGRLAAGQESAHDKYLGVAQDQIEDLVKATRRGVQVKRYHLPDLHGLAFPLVPAE